MVYVSNVNNDEKLKKRRGFRYALDHSTRARDPLASSISQYFTRAGLCLFLDAKQPHQFGVMVTTP